jgi:hypothetical protein
VTSFAYYEKDWVCVAIWCKVRIRSRTWNCVNVCFMCMNIIFTSSVNRKFSKIFKVPVFIFCFIILTSVIMTKDGVRIRNWIYWILTGRN